MLNLCPCFELHYLNNNNKKICVVFLVKLISFSLKTADIFRLDGLKFMFLHKNIKHKVHLALKAFRHTKISTVKK